MHSKSRLALLLQLALVGTFGCRGGTDDTSVCPSEDTYQGNQTRAGATVISLESLVNGHTNIEGYRCPFAEDWFALDLFAGQTLEVDLSLLQQDGDLQLDLVDESGGTIESSTSITDHESIRFTLTNDQRVFIRIYGDVQLSEGAYTLGLTVIGTPCHRDAFEPNDSGSAPWPLAEGEYQGMTVCYGEDDWYEIPVVDGQVANLDLIYDNTQAELRAVLFREDATGALQWLAGSQPTDTGAELVGRVSGAGPFLAQVVRGADTANATYDLNVTIAGDACVPDPFEPNDGYYGATEVNGDTLFEGGTVCLGDQDWFKISLKNGQVLSANLLFNQLDGDLGLWVYELLPDGTISYRAGSNSTDDDETILYRTRADADYLVYVAPTRGARSGLYNLDLKVLGAPCVQDLWEPNDISQDAAPLTTGSYASMALCVGDVDWYSFSAQNGQLISSSIRFDPANNTDLGLYLYRINTDGTLTARAASDTTTPHESISYRPFEDGDFALRVTRSRGTELATYSMDFALTGQACAADAFEPNDAYPEATPIGNGLHTGQTLCVGDADWFEVEASNGQMLNLDLSFVHADNDLGIAVYKKNDDGTITHRASSDTLTDRELIRYQPYDSGTFLVYVYRSRGTQVASYDLKVDVVGSACAADSFEPNDQSWQASPITPGSYPGITLCSADTDWYSTNVVNGQSIHGQLNFVHAQNDLGLRIYKKNDDGTLSYRAGSDTLTNNEIVDYQPYDDGTFLLNVYRSRGTALANYDLDFDIRGSACLPDGGGLEPNNHWSQAKPISEGLHAGMTLCVADDDWFTIPANNGQIIDVKLNFTHADNDLGVQVYERNADGTVVYRAGVDSLTDNEWLQYTPYQDGEFLIHVYRSRGTTSATYDMEVGVLGSACVPDNGDPSLGAVWEPNDHWLQTSDFSGQINAGQPTDFSLCVGDIDYFALGSFNAGDVINAKAFFTHALNDVDLYLYRINGDGSVTNLGGSASMSDNEYINYVVPADQSGAPIVVRTNVSRGTRVAQYGLQVDVVPAPLP